MEGADVLPDYETIQVLPARGENVSLARCTSDGRLVAITRCTDALANAARPALGRTLTGVASLVSADVSRNRAPARLVSSWVCGTTLHEQVLLQGALDANLAIRMIDRVAQGVRELHVSGASHGFVSPHSIVVEPASESAVLTYAAPTNDARWHSPQRLRDGHPGRADDVWALHMVLLYMLLGQRPFQGETSSEAVLASIESGCLERAILAVQDASAARVLRTGLVPGGPGTTIDAFLASLVPPSGSDAFDLGGATYAPMSSQSVGVSALTERHATGSRLRGWQGGVGIGLLTLAGVVVTQGWVTSPTSAQHATSEPLVAPRSSAVAPPEVAHPAPLTSLETISKKEPVEQCVRRHFLPEAFRPDRAIGPICGQADGRVLVDQVTRSLVLAADGRLTPALNEWSRLRGFQSLVIALVRARCCEHPAPWRATPHAQHYWATVDELTSESRQGRLSVDALANFRRAAVGAASWWWNASAPCKGGQRWFDQFATRNGWPAAAVKMCNEFAGR